MHRKPAEMYFSCNKRLLLPLDQFALWLRAGVVPSPGDVNKSPQASPRFYVFAGLAQQGVSRGGGASLDQIWPDKNSRSHASTSGHNKLKKDLNSKRLRRDSAVPATSRAFSKLTFKCPAKSQACDKSTLWCFTFFQWARWRGASVSLIWMLSRKHLPGVGKIHLCCFWSRAAPNPASAPPHSIVGEGVARKEN